jgi:hypothetical protein
VRAVRRSRAVHVGSPSSNGLLAATGRGDFHGIRVPLRHDQSHMIRGWKSGTRQAATWERLLLTRAAVSGLAASSAVARASAARPAVS